MTYQRIRIVELELLSQKMTYVENPQAEVPVWLIRGGDCHPCVKSLEREIAQSMQFGWKVISDVQYPVKDIYHYQVICSYHKDLFGSTANAPDTIGPEDIKNFQQQAESIIVGHDQSGQLLSLPNGLPEFIPLDYKHETKCHCELVALLTYGCKCGGT